GGVMEQTLIRRASGSTVSSLVAAQARLFPDTIALQDAHGGEQITYGELDTFVARAAHVLVTRGVNGGDRIAVLAENSSEYIVLMLACGRIGAVLACQNWRLAPAELAHCLRLVEPVLVIASERYLPLLEQVDRAGWEASECVSLDDLKAAWCLSGPVEPDAYPDPESALLILYTSGTTGLPKGAVISHRAQIARNMVLRNEFALAPSDTFVCWTPLYHMGGADHALGTLLVGGKVIVLDGFNADVLAHAAAEEPIGWLVVMPGTTEQVIDAIKRLGRPIVSVRVCGVMADLIPRHLIVELTTLLDAPFVNTFGSTETGSPPASASLLPIGALPEKLSKRQSRFCEVMLIDEHGVEVGVGKPGELLIRGPTLFSGYWANPQANLEAFGDGWFHMGDVFIRNPDGTLDFVDRAKYMIKSGGENIYPAEIERVLLADDRVTDAAVIRRADDRWGEVPVAFLSRSDVQLDEDVVIALCRAQLAGFKQPKEVYFIEFDDFPRSASGKIQRHELERLYERQRSE
ncbi:MAG: acyl-CoA synthetase (AMP-forming)/AMP-acid ligase II, partial [Gammaproteobacteria bacterium]